MKKWCQVYFGVVLILMFVSRAVSAPMSTESESVSKHRTTTITVLFTNSTNGMLRACPTCPNLLYGGLVRRATLIKEYRQKYKNILLLDSGDLFPVIAPSEQAECALEAVNLMKYDAIGIGDQEFVYGKRFLLSSIQRANFPFLSATIVYEKPDKSDGYKTSLFARPYIIKEIAKLKILIVGVISDRAFIFFPKDKIEGLTILEPAMELSKILSELKDKVNFVIVLSHLGDESDKRLAQMVSGIDLIIGGHTQTLIEEPIRIGNTIIVQAGKNGEHLGEITLNINKVSAAKELADLRSSASTTIENYKLTLLTDKIPDDSEVKNLVDELYKLEESERLARRKADTISTPVSHTVPSLFFLNPEWDLGTVEKGRIIENEIKLQNIGSDTLVIKKIRSSCDCLDASLKKELIAPHDKSSINLRFFSGEVIGETFSYNLYIESNDPDQPVSVILVKGRVIKTDGIDKNVVRRPSSVVSRKDNDTTVKKMGMPIGQTGRLPVMFFYSPGCHSCEEIKNEFLPSIKKKYPETVEIREYNISKKENYELLVGLEEKYGVRKSAPMEIFVGNQYLIGRKEIKESLEPTILAFMQRGQRPPDFIKIVTVPRAENKILQRFKSFGPVAIIMAGLIDGINPCAFATIVFFISFLGYIGRSKKDTLLTGIFFTTGVFCAYLLLGIGLFKILHSLLVFDIISRIIFYAIFVLTLGLGFLSLYDAYIFKKTGDTQKIALQLPRSVKENIHFWIRKNIGTSSIITGAFTTGLLISLLEAVCTGQIYLPTITFMTKEPSLAAKAYFYLVLYNLMFIVPLVIVFSLAYLGVGSQKLRQFSQRHLVFTKVLTAIFFFGLATLLVMLK